jgi:hypothetical protein
MSRQTEKLLQSVVVVKGGEMGPAGDDCLERRRLRWFEIL